MRSLMLYHILHSLPPSLTLPGKFSLMSEVEVYGRVTLVPTAPLILIPISKLLRINVSISLKPWKSTRAF